MSRRSRPPPRGIRVQPPHPPESRLLLALALGATWSPSAFAACPRVRGATGHYDLCVDAAIAAGLWAGSAVLARIPHPAARPRLFGERSDAPEARYDLVAAGRSDWLSPAGGPASAPITVVGVGLAGVTTVAFGSDDGASPRHGWAGVLASAEALSATALITQAVKRGTSQPRPYTSRAFEEAYPDLYEPLYAHPDAFRSMPSGHASMTAALLFTPTTLWLLGEVDATRAGRHPQWALAGPVVAAGVAAGVTAHVGALRVRSGAHHRDDVLVGGLVGATVGVAVPVLHTLPGRDGPVTWTVGRRGLGIAGAW